MILDFWLSASKTFKVLLQVFAQMYFTDCSPCFPFTSGNTTEPFGMLSSGFGLLIVLYLCLVVFNVKAVLV